MKRLASFLLPRDQRDDGAVIVECRRCGMTIEPAESRCSACGADEIVQYTIK